MDLLEYLAPMKNLPDRFSNLAFWREVRKLKNEVVNAFEYVEKWGNGIESEIDSLKAYVTLEMFGGSGDGVTINDTAFRQAIESGYDIVLKNGTYLFSGEYIDVGNYGRRKTSY